MSEMKEFKQRVIELLTQVQRMNKEALTKFDWGKSYLDQNAIMLLNNVPIAVDTMLVELTELPKLNECVVIKNIFTGDQTVCFVMSSGGDEPAGKYIPKRVFLYGVGGLSTTLSVGETWRYANPDERSMAREWFIINRVKHIEIMVSNGDVTRKKADEMLATIPTWLSEAPPVVD
jgi:hypothetical protein